MNTILSRIFKFMKGLLIDSILAIVFAVLLIIIFKNYIWVEGQTFEQWYLQISGCDLTNSKGDLKCLITNMSVCWHCAIFDQIWNIMNFVAYKFYDFFTKITLIIIAFSFAFWLLIEMTFKKFVKSASPAPDTLSPKDYSCAESKDPIRPFVRLNQQGTSLFHQPANRQSALPTQHKSAEPQNLRHRQWL